MNIDFQEPAFALHIPQEERTNIYNAQGLSKIEYVASMALPAMIRQLGYSPYDVTENAVSVEELAEKTVEVAKVIIIKCATI